VRDDKLIKKGKRNDPDEMKWIKNTCAQRGAG
jgi:hypothetical protein